MEIDLSKLHVPFLSNKQIWEHADKFREKYSDNTIPVDIELILEKEFDIQIIPIDNLRKLIRMDAFISGNLKEILYDTYSPENRLRFSFAEEAGHLHFHSDIIKQLRSKPFTKEDWIRMMIEMPSETRGRVEYQAKEFAGRLLVPKTNLLQKIEGLTDLFQRLRESQKNGKVEPIEEEVLYGFIAPKIFNDFKVSSEVIARRLSKEDIKNEFDFIKDFISPE